jgi:hypothetical protein
MKNDGNFGSVIRAVHTLFWMPNLNIKSGVDYRIPKQEGGAKT